MCVMCVVCVCVFGVCVCVSVCVCVCVCGVCVCTCVSVCVWVCVSACVRGGKNVKYMQLFVHVCNMNSLVKWMRFSLNVGAARMQVSKLYYYSVERTSDYYKIHVLLVALTRVPAKPLFATFRSHFGKSPFQRNNIAHTHTCMYT